MARALVCSDLHVHNHKGNVERLHHCLDVLRWIFRTATDRRCDHILFLGDLFHEKSRIDVLNYLSTFEVFMEFFIDNPSPIQTYLLIGNHDMYHKEQWHVNSVKPLSALRDVHIVDRPCTIDIGGVPIDFCPHTANPLPHLEAFGKDRRLLLGHLAVHGSILNKVYGNRADVIVEYDTDMVPVTPDVFAEWDMTILGHYHAAQQLNDKVEYIGSPLQLSFGEASQDKHVMILDLDTLEKEYVVNDFSPKHYILDAHDLDSHDLNGQFVRVVVDEMKTSQVSEITHQVNSLHKVASFDFQERDRSSHDMEVVKEAKILSDDHEETMKNYVEAAILPDDVPDRARLLKIGLELRSQVA